MNGALRRLARVATAGLLVCLAGLLGPASPALAEDSSGPLSLVHREQVTAGPYRLTVAFTEWPMFHDRSLDIVFRPADGVDRVRGNLTLISPSGQEKEEALLRHPRMRDAYGLDIYAFDEQGRWTMRFDLNGPRGPGEGKLAVNLGPRPGPPIEVGWVPTLAVIAVMIGFAIRWWRRYRPEPASVRSWVAG